MSVYPDGMLTSDARGRVCRAFSPPRWAVWRWLVWLLLPRARKAVEWRTVIEGADVVGGAVCARYTRRRVRLIVCAERAS